MGSAEAILRLSILEALERVEGISTRESGISDLKRIVQEHISGENVKVFLRLLFSDRNRKFFNKLIPLLINISSKVPSRIFSQDCVKYLINALRDGASHSSADHTWKSLLDINFVDPSTVLDSLHVSGRSESDLRKGLAYLLITTVQFAVKSQNDKWIERLIRDILKLYSSQQFLDIQPEILESMSLLLPSGTQIESDTLSDLIRDILDILGGHSKTKLTRSLSLASCRFLKAIAHHTEGIQSLIPFKPDVAFLLSRENLRLFALTRSNASLRVAINEAQDAWRTLSSAKPTERLSDLRISPQRDCSEITMPLSSVRVVDSPITLSETSFELFQKIPDNKSESPLRPFPSPEYLYDDFPSAAIPEEPNPLISVKTRLSQTCPENTRFIFQELVSRLSSSWDPRTRSRIYDSLLELCDVESFPDNINSSDVMELYTLLSDSKETSPEAQLLFYKFFS